METSNPKKINVLLFPFLNIYYILLNAFNGLVFVIFRLPVILFEMISFRLDKTYRKFKGENMKPELNLRNTIMQGPKKRVYK